MSFYRNLIKSIGIKKKAQPVPYRAPAPVAQPVDQSAIPVNPFFQPDLSAVQVPQPAIGVPFSGTGNQEMQKAKNNNLKQDMANWIRINLPILMSKFNNYRGGRYTQEDMSAELEFMLKNDKDGNRWEWIDNDLFWQTLGEFSSSVLEGESYPQLISDPYPDLSVDEIRSIINNQKNSNKKEALPPQLTQNSNNMAIYDAIVREMREKGEFGNLSEESAPIAGISSQDLAKIFYDNYIEATDDMDSDPDNIDSYKRYNEITSLYPDQNSLEVLESRVFRGMPGGYGPRGEEDFRIKFFIENASWLSGLGMLPESVQRLLDNGKVKNSKENYINLYQDIDTITNTLASILSDDDPGIKERVWRWARSKLGSDAMKDRKTFQEAVSEDGSVVEHGNDRRLDEITNNSIESPLDEEQRLNIINAYKGDLQSMGQTLRYLGSDIRNHIINNISKNNPKFAPGGEWYSKTLASEFLPDQAANIIDSLVNSNAFSDPNKLKDLERKGKATFKIDEGGRVIMRPAKGNTWDSIDFSKMIPLDEKINIWIDGMVNDGSNVDPDSYYAGLRNVDQLGNIKVDKNKLNTNELVRVDDPEDFKNTPHEGKTHVPYRTYLEQKLKKSKRLHAQMDQILSHIGDYLTSDEVTDKYPKNVIMAYLDLITTHKNIKQVGALMSQNSQAGDRARRELALRLIDKGDKNPHKGNPLIGKYTKQDIANMDDDQIKNMVENYIESEIATRSNVSRKAQDYYQKLLDREDVRMANLLRRISIIKKAVSRVHGLRKLSSSMSKFASTNYLQAMKNSIRNEMRQRLSQL